MDFDTIVNKIIEKTSLTNEDVKKKILEKQQELSNLVSKEGAAYIIAKELGLEMFPKVERKLEIKNIVPKIRNLKLGARVVRIFETREFETKGRKGKVASLILGDASGTIRMSLWDDQTEIAEKIEPGMAIETFGAFTREDGLGNIEIRLGKNGGIKILKDSSLPPLEKITGMPERRITRTNIVNLKEGEYSEIRASLVQLFETNIFYDVCPECGAKVSKENDSSKCKKHGVVEPAKAIVLSGVVDDGTGNIRAVFFRNAGLQLIGMNIEEAVEKGNGIFDLDTLGKEFVITGKIRRNKMFNRLEFVANNVKEINVIDEANKIINNLASNVN